MVIAAVYNDGNVFSHFGRAEQFKLYEVEDNKVISTKIIGNGGLSHGALVGLLADNNVNVLFVGGIGFHAIEMLSSKGIKTFPGVSGNADKNVEDYLNGNLTFNEGAAHECHH